MENINLASFDIDESKITQKIEQLEANTKALNEQREREMKILSSLNKQYNEQTKELDTLRKAGQKSSDQYNELNSKRNKLVIQIAEERTEVSNLNKQIRENNTESNRLTTTLENQAKAVHILSDSYNLESKSIDQLRADRKVLIQLRNQEVAVMGEQSEQAVKLNKLIADTTNQEKKLVSETEKRFYQIGDYAGQLQGNFQDLKDAILQIGSGNVVGGLNNLKSSLGGVLTSIRALALTPVGAIVTGVVALGAATKYVLDYNASISETLTLINNLTGAVGQNADKIRQYSQALTDTYGVDFEETIRNTKNLVNSFGISSEEAFDLYSQGLAKGGAANKKFGDSINEYGVQFANAGYSAEEFISVINSGFDLGIYTDKLPDAIKEAGISLNEQTKATRDALTNAFGASFSNDLLKRIRTGQTTVKTALEEISSQAEKANLNQQQLATLTADIFRDAGETAGGAEKIFQAVNKSVEDLNVPMNELQQSNDDLYQSYVNLEKAKDNAFKSDSLIKLQKDTKIFWNEFKTASIEGVAEFVRIWVDGITQISAGLKTVYDFINTDIKEAANFDWSATYEGYAGSSSARGQAISKATKMYKDALTQLNNTVIEETNKVLTQKSPTKDTPTTPKIDTKAIAAAKKRAAEAKKALEDSIKMNKKYLEDLANLQYTYAQNELSNQIKLNSDKIKNAKILTDEMLEIEKNRITETQKLQEQANNLEIERANERSRTEKANALQEIDKLKISEEQKNQLRINTENVLNEQLAINQQAYQQKQLDTLSSFAVQRNELETTFYENRKAIEEQRRQFDFEQELLSMQNNGSTERDLQLAQLNQQYQEESALLREKLTSNQITLEQFSTASSNLAKTRADNELMIEQNLQSQKMSVISDTLGGISQLLGESSEAGKAFAVAQSLINTYQGITEVWAAKSTLPEPFATISKVASTATVLASGLNAVKQIKQVNVNSSSNSASTTTSSLGTTTNTLKSDYAGGAIQGYDGNSSITGYTQNTTFVDSNSAKLIQDAVSSGAKQGTQEGSYNGSQQGLKDLNTDRQILSNGNY